MEETQRIKNLVDAVKQIKKEDFPVHVNRQVSDEFGELEHLMMDLGIFLEHRFLELKQFEMISRKINAGVLLEEVFNFAYDSFRHMIPYDRIGVSFLEDEGRMLRAKWARSESDHMHIKQGYSAKMQGSSLQSIIDTGQPRILNDLEDYLKRNPQSEATQLIVKEGMRSSLTCPLIALERPIGFMFFSSMKLDTYRDVHADTFLSIASQFSIIAEKSRLYENLVALNKTKNELLGMAAHDLRNPLAVIMDASSFLLDEGVGVVSKDQGRFLKMIYDSSTFMLSIVNNCLDVAQIESGKLTLDKKEIDVNAFIEKSVSINRLFAKKKEIAIQVQCQPDIRTAYFDSRRIEQVLNNLISNAVKYSNPGTTISLMVETEGEKLKISVRDEGLGIPKDEQVKLFQPFSKTSTRGTAGESSTGLGLLITKKNVEGHGGSIWVESEPGQGSTFSFVLPRKNPVADGKGES